MHFAALRSGCCHPPATYKLPSLSYFILVSYRGKPRLSMAPSVKQESHLPQRAATGHHDQSLKKQPPRGAPAQASHFAVGCCGKEKENSLHLLEHVSCIVSFPETAGCFPLPFSCSCSSCFLLPSKDDKLSDLQVHVFVCCLSSLCFASPMLIFTCLCVGASVHVGVSAHVCACLWKPEVHVGNHPPALFYLF